MAGDGPPLVYVAGWLTHLELSWAMPPERRYYEMLTRGRTLVRYDKPGCGLSGHCARPPSMDLELEALSGVVEAAGGGRVDLLGASFGAVVAAAWAAMYPDRVSRLVLYGGWVRGRDVADPAMRQQPIGAAADAGPARTIVVDAPRTGGRRGWRHGRRRAGGAWGGGDGRSPFVKWWL